MILSELGEDTVLYDKVSGRFLNSEILEREDYVEYVVVMKREGLFNIKSLKTIEYRGLVD